MRGPVSHVAPSIEGPVIQRKTVEASTAAHYWLAVANTGRRLAADNSNATMLAGVCFGSHCPAASASASTPRPILATCFHSNSVAGQLPTASLDSGRHKKFTRGLSIQHSIRSPGRVWLGSVPHNSESCRHRTSCSAVGPSICSTSAPHQITIQGETQEEVYERLVDRVLTTAQTCKR